MKKSYKCSFVFIAFWWFYLLRYSSLLFEIIVLIFYTNNDLYKENFTYLRTVFAYMYVHVPQSLKKLVKNINNSLGFLIFLPALYLELNTRQNLKIGPPYCRLEYCISWLVRKPLHLHRVAITPHSSPLHHTIRN